MSAVGAVKIERARVQPFGIFVARKQGFEMFVAGFANTLEAKALAFRELPVETATAGEITRHELRPDLYPQEAAE